MLFFCTSLSLLAESTPFSGQIVNPVTRTLTVEYVYNHFTGEDTFFQADVKSDGTFSTALNIDCPTVIFLSHGGKKLQVFVENGQPFHFSFNAVNPQKSLDVFWEQTLPNTAQHTSQNNQLFSQYYQEYKTNQNENLLFVGGLGAKVNNEELHYYQTHNGNENFKYIQEKKKGVLDFLEEKKKEFPQATTAYEYIKTDIIYYWNTQLAMFAKSLNPSNQEAYEQEMSFFNIKDEQIFNHPQFLMFLNIYAMKSCETSKELNFYKDVKTIYGCIKRNDDLGPPVKEEMLGKLLYLNMRSEAITEVTPLFNDFMKTVQSSKIIDSLVKKYEKINQFKDGVTAPTFELKNQYGESISLNDLRGKMVFLSFWANWCKPCIRNMENSRDIKAALANESIEFVYVSIDNQEDLWQNSEIVKTESGTHLWADRRFAPILKAYKVAVLPKYYLIDKEGKFITGFPSIIDEKFVDFIKSKNN